LIHFTQASFSEVFRAWIHLKAIRLFVESVLRYGLPVNFQAYLLKVSIGKDKLLRSALGDLYAHLAAAHLTSQDASEVDFSGLGQDFYPYVYLSIDHSLN
jgi:V-type H+-transporting ATPase subunit C